MTATIYCQNCRQDVNAAYFHGNTDPNVGVVICSHPERRCSQTYTAKLAEEAAQQAVIDERDRVNRAARGE